MIVFTAVACGGGDSTTSPSPTPSSSCNYALSVGSSITGYAYGVTLPVTVTTTPECAWTAVSNVSWIHVQAFVSGTGSFTFTVDANSSGLPRTGTLTIAYRTLSFNQPSLPILPPSAVTITFSGLTVNEAPVTAYSESGFTVSTRSGSWIVKTTYGNPAPFIQFGAEAGNTVTGEVRITANEAFSFKAVDLYSSTTTIPYTLTGLRNSTPVFAVADTLPNTFGNFKTVLNPNATDIVDTLSIILTNPAATCCRNPMGLDNIVLTR